MTFFKKLSNFNEKFTFKNNKILFISQIFERFVKLEKVEYKLKISGKLSDRVTLKANIWDTNIPIQENGYSQNITDFDRIFIEMFADDWRVRAGDLSLKNQNSYSILSMLQNWLILRILVLVFAQWSEVL